MSLCAFCFSIGKIILSEIGPLNDAVQEKKKYGSEDMGHSLSYNPFSGNGQLDIYRCEGEMDIEKKEEEKGVKRT